MSGTPEHIGRYQIERVLGRGAMGVIYKAHDPEIDRTVAIKLIRADLLEGEEQAAYLARFRREAQAAGRCNHPNIVALYDYSVNAANPFLVMEYVEGVSLAHALGRGMRFATADAVSIMLQVLDALSCAHALGVVHRDIKPANILLIANTRVQVKVTDFGISRLGASTITLDGSVVGTPAYMSPEQCRGEEVDHRSDLFSVGTVLFELLSGQRPFPGDSVSEVTAKVLFAEPPDLHGRVPEPLVAVLRRALAKRPEDRFDSAAAMADALRGRMSAPADVAVAETIVRIQPEREPAVVSDAVLTTLQRRLARDIGPIAKALVTTAARKAPDFDALCDLLASNISADDDRRAFLRDVRQHHGSGVTGSPARRTAASPISGATIELAQAELTRIIGPIARVLVKRAAGSCTSPAELWQALARHIDQDAERAAFLRTQPGG
ncbi:MAG TPA: serine/threonine-protein kinase [Acetobacteraceae bacterium]